MHHGKNSATAEKALVLAGAQDSAFTHVDIEAIDPSAPVTFNDRAGKTIEVPREIEDFLVAVGRQQALDAVCSFTTVMWAENIYRLKTSKAYKAMDITWEQACAKYFSRYSVDTCDRYAKEFREFGRTIFEVREIVRISAQAYREINPTLTDDGKIVIAGESYALTKANASVIQVAIEAQRQRIAGASDANTNLKAQVTKAKEAKAAAEKKAAKAEQALAVAENPILSWQQAEDADHALLLKMQANLDLMCVQIGNFAKREISPANQTRVVAFCKYAWAAIHQAGDIACAEYGVGLNTPVPAEWLDIDMGTEERRDLVNEYNAEHFKK